MSMALYGTEHKCICSTVMYYRSQVAFMADCQLSDVKQCTCYGALVSNIIVCIVYLPVLYRSFVCDTVLL